MGLGRSFLTASMIAVTAATAATMGCGGDDGGAGIAPCDPGVAECADGAAPSADAASDAVPSPTDAGRTDAASQTDSDVASQDGAVDGASFDGGADAASDAADGGVVCGVPTTSAVHNVKVVHGYENGYCALDDGGAVRCQGEAWVEDPSTHAVTLVANALPTPTIMPGLDSGVIDLGVGIYRWCALKSNGDVLCWGKNDVGQLGDATFTGAARATPGLVKNLGVAKSLSVGPEHACAILDDKTARCWGSNHLEILGHAGLPSTAGSFSATPVAVDGVANATLLRATGMQSCALETGGALKCWGWSAILPGAGLASGIVDFDLAGYSGCAKTDTGALKCWAEARAGTYTAPTIADAQEVPGVTGFVAFRTKSYGACVLMGTGVVRCWGMNYNGRTPAKGYLDWPPTVPVDVPSLGTHVGALRINISSQVIAYDTTTHEFLMITESGAGHSEQQTAAPSTFKTPLTCGGTATVTSFRQWAEGGFPSYLIDDGYQVLHDAALD